MVRILQCIITVLNFFLLSIIDLTERAESCISSYIFVTAVNQAGIDIEHTYYLLLRLIRNVVNEIFLGVVVRVDIFQKALV